MLKFKPEDIYNFVLKDSAIAITSVFQKVFDTWLKENGKVVKCLYLKESNLTDEHGPGWIAKEESGRHTELYTHKALLINIEPIEKCNHPKEKVRRFSGAHVEGENIGFFVCECGAKVHPCSYEEIK